MRRRQRGGFTLVELSIVLVIIGLLIGGILAAQSMISTAKNNAQVRQLQQFDIAFQNFKSNYNRLPGEQLMPTIVGGGSAVVGNNRYDASCCVNNPGGDFRLYYAEATYSFAELYSYSMISETFTPIFGSAQNASGHASLGGFGTGHFLPASKISAGGQAGGIIPVSNAGGDIFWFVLAPLMGVNSLNYGISYGDYGPSLVPIDALALDAKLDDGNPATGNVVAVAVRQGPSSDSDYLPLPVIADDGTCISGGKYNTAQSSPKCDLLIKAQVN